MAPYFFCISITSARAEGLWIAAKCSAVKKGSRNGPCAVNWSIDVGGADVTPVDVTPVDDKRVDVTPAVVTVEVEVTEAFAADVRARVAAAGVPGGAEVDSGTEDVEKEEDEDEDEEVL